jgi:hypothetical protein
VTYGDVYHQNEVEQSTYNFEYADVEKCSTASTPASEAQKLVEAGLPLPAYEQVMKASHTFNLLDARRAISVTERQRYILRVRTLAQAVAKAYHEQREKLGFPGRRSRRRPALGLPRWMRRRTMSATMKPLLIELGTEELPVKALPGLAQAFFDGIVEGLRKRGVAAAGRRRQAAVDAAPTGRAAAGRGLEQPEQHAKCWART